MDQVTSGVTQTGRGAAHVVGAFCDLTEGNGSEGKLDENYVTFVSVTFCDVTEGILLQEQQKHED